MPFAFRNPRDEASYHAWSSTRKPPLILRGDDTTRCGCCTQSVPKRGTKRHKNYRGVICQSCQRSTT